MLSRLMESAASLIACVCPCLIASVCVCPILIASICVCPSVIASICVFLSPHLCTDSLVAISTEEVFLPGEKAKVLAAQNACGSF